MEKLIILYNVFRRIRFFRKMYPVSTILRDAFLLPVDYLSVDPSIRTVNNVTVAVTHRCNIRCEMCYFKDELSDRKILPFEVFQKVVDSVKHSRPCIILSGGEPFTHPSIVDMVDFAKKAGLPVQIFTNGTLLTPAMTDKLTSLGLDYINFTLLGDEQSHNTVAGVPNAYERLLANIEYFCLHRQNTKVMLNYTLTPRAFKDVLHAAELARRLTVDGLRIQHYNFLTQDEFAAHARVMERVFPGHSIVNETGLSDDLSAMAPWIIGVKGKLQKTLRGIPVQWAPTLTDEETRNWYSVERFSTQRKCLFPWRGILVDADAKVYPCSKIYLELGDLRRQDVLDSWNGTTMKTFRRILKKGLFPACSRCCKL